MAALDGIRVLDMTTAIAGPYCGQMLADLGADVIKVEHPGRALNERVQLSPTWDGPAFAPFWLAANRNKRSVTLNLRRDDGRAVMADLVRQADVVLENFASDARPKLVDEQWAWEVNPRVIWVSLSFSGRTGPQSAMNGFDLLAQARSGIMSLTGPEEIPPLKAGPSVVDYLAGTHMAVGALGALRQRDVTGRGQLVDISLLETAVACLDGYPLWYSIAGILPPRIGNGHPSGHPGYAVFECTDGYVVTSVSFSGMADLVQNLEAMRAFHPLPEQGDPAFMPRIKAVMHALGEWAHDLSTAEVCEVLTRASVSNAPVRTMADLFDDEQLRARNMIVDYEYGDLGTFEAIGSPLHLSDSEPTVQRMPPAAGAHNEEVLRELLGYDDARITELVANGTLWGWEAG